MTPASGLGRRGEMAGLQPCPLVQEEIALAPSYVQKAARWSAGWLEGAGPHVASLVPALTSRGGERPVVPIRQHPVGID